MENVYNRPEEIKKQPAHFTEEGSLLGSQEETD
jgi:hypothetical protein